MKFLTISLLLLITLNISANAQSEMVRGSLPYVGNNFFQSQGWADENGYLLIRFQYSSNFNAFRLVHRDKGEVSSYVGDVGISEIFGFTSNDLEFTIYFKGFALNKKGYYFLTFFKNSERAPVLNAWIDKTAYGDYLVSYSAFGKLYLLKEEKGKLTLIEVTDYGTSKVIAFQASKEQLKKFKFETYFWTSYPETSAIGREQTALCFKDSIILTGVEKSPDFKHFTRLTKFNYADGIITERPVSSGVSGAITSKILGDRLYQLRFSTQEDLIELKVYQYPALKLLHEFKYAEGEEIGIKTSPLLRDGKKNKEDKWSEEKKDIKILKELLKGSPYLSVQHDSTNTKVLIESKIIVTSSTYGGVGGGPTTSSSEYWVGFDACFDDNGNPCPTEIPKTVYYRAADSSNRLKEENLSDKVCTIESSSFVYNIHYNGKTKEYFIEKFKK